VRFLIALTNYYRDDQIKNIEMGEVCGTYGGEQMYIQGFRGATRRKDATWRNYYLRLDDNIKMDLKEVV